MFDLIAQNDTLRFALLAAVFVLVVGLAFFATSAINARQAARSRLSTGRSLVSDDGQVMTSLRQQNAETAWLKLVNAVESTGLSLVDTKGESLRRKLIAAGYTAPYAPRVYTLVRLMGVFGLPCLMLLLMWLSGSSPGMLRLYFTMMISALMGLYLPSLFIRVKADRRERELINSFPDALDLMLVCVEAGLGLEAAFGRVGMEMTQSHPLLAEQFGAVVLELRAGRSREDALRRLADRSGADEIRAFATLLIQSTKLGSSIAQTLRIYASEMRERRRLRAEEKAHRLPVLLSIPLVACMLPTMIGVLMLPAVIRVMRQLIPALS